MKQRVDDGRLASILPTPGEQWPTLECRDLALDLRDARRALRAAEAKLAAWKPVVKAAVEAAVSRHDRMNDGGSECFNGCAACTAREALLGAVDALPNEMKP